MVMAPKETEEGKGRRETAKKEAARAAVPI